MSVDELKDRKKLGHGFIPGLLLVLALTTASGSDTGSRTPPAGPQATSSHFLIYSVGSWRSDRLIRETLSALEAWHRRLMIAMETVPQTPITVILYPSDLFHPTTGVPHWADGVYEANGIIRLAIGGAARLDPDLERVLAHELAHAFIAEQSMGRAPRWLHEGMAQYLSGSVLLDPTAVRRTGVLLEELDYDATLSFTQALIARFGVSGLVDVLDQLGMGEETDTAFHIVTGLALESHYRQWQMTGELALAEAREGQVE